MKSSVGIRAIVASLASSLLLIGCSHSQTDADQELIRRLYSQETRAMTISSKSWQDFVLEHDYPGSVDAAQFRACMDGTPWPSKYSVVPNLATLTTTPNWKGPSGSLATADWMFAGKQPKGKTFSLTVAVSINGDLREETNHVTILRGKAYFYKTACK